MRKLLIGGVAVAAAISFSTFVPGPVANAFPYCSNGGVEVWTPQSHYCEAGPPQVAQNQPPTFEPPAPYIPPGGLPPRQWTPKPPGSPPSPDDIYDQPGYS
jgi:hypothetical protein